MAIDTAEDRRAIAGLSLAHFYGPGVTPNNDKDAEWRSEVGYGYPNVPFAPEYTDTQDIQLPVDCALAGKQLIKDGYREFDIRPMDEVNATVASGRAPVRLKGGKPSFTVKTGTRGFD